MTASLFNAAASSNILLILFLNCCSVIFLKFISEPNEYQIADVKLLVCTGGETLSDELFCDEFADEELTVEELLEEVLESAGNDVELPVSESVFEELEKLEESEKDSSLDVDIKLVVLSDELTAEELPETETDPVEAVYSGLFAVVKVSGRNTPIIPTTAVLIMTITEIITVSKVLLE